MDPSPLARLWGHKPTDQSVEATEVCLGVKMAGQGNGKVSATVSISLLPFFLVFCKRKKRVHQTLCVNLRKESLVSPPVASRRPVIWLQGTETTRL